MLNGEKPPSCLKCYKEEAAGHNSKRMWETDYWLNRYSIEDMIGETAEEGSRAMALEFIRPKIERKPGPGGFLVNVLINGDCRFWQIDYQKVLDNEDSLNHIKATQGAMQINFEELFG